MIKIKVIVSGEHTTIENEFEELNYAGVLIKAKHWIYDRYWYNQFQVYEIYENDKLIGCGYL